MVPVLSDKKNDICCNFATVIQLTDVVHDIYFFPSPLTSYPLPDKGIGHPGLSKCSGKERKEIGELEFVTSL